jgi:hypothetical protein
MHIATKLMLACLVCLGAGALVVGLVQWLG